MLEQTLYPKLFPRIALLLLTVITVQCGTKTTDTVPAGDVELWSIDRAQVLFSATRGTARELFILDRSTSNTAPLTRSINPGTASFSGRVSPDGNRVAFQINDGKNYEIHVMDLTGSPSQNFSNHPEYDVLPVWSPDGRQLAFMSTRGFELGGIGPFPGHVYVADLDGTGLRQITVEPLTSSLGPSDWSQDGKMMLIARVNGERPDLFLLDAASGSETRLTETPEGEYAASFSSDGLRVAFHSETDSGSQINVMNIDGTEPRAITEGPGFNYNPRWSPDDRWLLFTASDDGNQYDLRAVEVKTGNLIDIVATPEDERSGEWIPFGPSTKSHR